MYKKGAKKELKNYRPISILSNVSKIFEGLIYSRIYSFFNSRDFLSNNQFGFRAGRNTEMAVLKLIERVMPAMSEGKFAIAVFLDFSAAFDTISRDLLMHKLNRYGVRGVPYGFLKSYFADRRQFVCVGNAKSETMDQKTGIIQGSKMGPLFYDIYSNDINRICDEGECLLYADDLCLTFVDRDYDRLLALANLRLSEISLWCLNNKLKVNPAKSEFLLITHKLIPYEPTIHFNNDIILRKTNVRYLGIVIDHRLSFYDQLCSIRQKLSQLTGLVYRLNQYLTYDAAKKYYYSCVYSVFTYGLAAWGGILLCAASAPALERLQERLLRMLFRKYTNIDECIFKQTRTLKLRDIYRLHAGIYMFKIIRLNTCPTVTEGMPIRYPEHRYPTRRGSELVLPFPRVSSVRRGYQYQYIDIWNSLPGDIIQSTTLGQFKRKVSDHFMQLY